MYMYIINRQGILLWIQINRISIALFIDILAIALWKVIINVISTSVILSFKLDFSAVADKALSQISLQLLVVKSFLLHNVKTVYISNCYCVNIKSSGPSSSNNFIVSAHGMYTFCHWTQPEFIRQNWWCYSSSQFVHFDNSAKWHIRRHWCVLLPKILGRHRVLWR